MATYKEQLGKLFDEVGVDIGLQKTDKKAFIEWAYERHTRLRRRDKEWLEGKETNSSEKYLPSCQDYFRAVYEAIRTCAGIDYYTGKKLNWGITLPTEKTQQANTKKTEAQDTKTRQERVTFDHINGRELQNLKFVLCSGKTNDAKNDLTQIEFLELCQAVVDFFKVKKYSSGSSGQ